MQAQTEYVLNREELRKRALHLPGLARIVGAARLYRRIWLYTNEAEKFNYPDHETAITPEPKNNRYDHEGHTSVDVNGYYKLDFTNLDDVLHYFASLGDSLRHLYWGLRHLGPKAWPRYFGYALQGFGPWRSGWVWTISSFNSFRYDMVDDAIVKLRSDDKAYRTAIQNYDQMVRKIPHEEVMRRVQGFCYCLTPGLWVSRADPTNIFVDESLVAYDLKDGYSTRKAYSIVRIWMDLMFDISATVVEQSID